MKGGKPDLTVVMGMAPKKGATPMLGGDKSEDDKGDDDRAACVEAMQEFIDAVKSGDAEAAYEAWEKFDSLEKREEAGEEEDETDDEES